MKNSNSRNNNKIPREFEEVDGGKYNQYGFYYTPQGSFWDCDGIYFDRTGKDVHGGYYDEEFKYHPGEGWIDSLMCYEDELEYNNQQSDDINDYDDGDYDVYEDFNEDLKGNNFSGPSYYDSLKKGKSNGNNNNNNNNNRNNYNNNTNSNSNSNSNTNTNTNTNKFFSKNNENCNNQNNIETREERNNDSNNNNQTQNKGEKMQVFKKITLKDGPDSVTPNFTNNSNYNNNIHNNNNSNINSNSNSNNKSSNQPHKEVVEVKSITSKDVNEALQSNKEVKYEGYKISEGLDVSDDEEDSKQRNNYNRNKNNNNRGRRY